MKTMVKRKHHKSIKKSMAVLLVSAMLLQGQTGYLIATAGQVQAAVDTESAEKETLIETPITDEQLEAMQYALFSGGTSQLYLGGADMKMQGKVHSNGNIVMSSSLLSVGDSSAVSSIYLGAAVLDAKEKKEYAAFVPMPDITQSIYEMVAAEGQVYEGDTAFEAEHIDISKSMAAEGTLTLKGTEFTGRGMIYAEDSITYDVPRVTLGVDDSIILTSKKGDITINGSDTTMNGIIYAPNGTVNINSARFILNGRIIAKNITFRGSTLYVQPTDRDMELLEKALLKPAIDISGELKENRRITIKAETTTGKDTHYAAMTSGGSVTMEILPVSGGAVQEGIKIDEENSSSDYKEVLFKKAGTYEAVYTLTKGSVTKTATEQIVIKEDLAPVADFSMKNAVYRNQDGTAGVALTSQSVSPDDDNISNSVYKIRFDTNNNGSFSDEKETLVDAKEGQTVYETKKVGKYQVELFVKEHYTNTIPKFITDADYLTGDTLSKEAAAKVFEVKNKKPTVGGTIEKANNLDVVVALGAVDTDKKNELADRLDAIQKEFQSRGFNMRISGIGSKAYTAKDTFDWEKYGRQASIVINEDNIRMNGDRYTQYKDFLFKADDNPEEKIFSFQMQRDTTDWHSMEGGGFLFNTRIQDNMLEGYSLLLTQQGLKLVEIYPTSVSNFVNGRYNYVYQYGRVLKTVSMSNAYAKHDIKIQVTDMTVNIWAGEKLVIENYTLPTAPKSYGFGPITSHISHSCSQMSYFTFNDIYMETQAEKKTFTEALHEYEWMESSNRVILHYTEELSEEFADNEEIGEIAEILHGKGVAFAGMGTEDTVSQYALLNKNVDNPLTLSSQDMDKSLDELESYLKNIVGEKDTAINNYVEIGEEVTYPHEYADPETDTMSALAFKYIHNADVFPTNQGIIPNQDIFTKPLTSFTHTGEYEIWGKAQDAPSTDAAFDSYKKWSVPVLFKDKMIVHEKPIANFAATVSAIAVGTGTALTVAESSYDPDDGHELGNGIESKTWKWKKLSDDKWNDGSLPDVLDVQDEYLIYLQVRDAEGSRSAPIVQYISTKHIEAEEIDAAPPVVTIDMPQLVWTVGDTIMFNVSAVSEKSIEEFYVYINGVLFSTDMGRQIIQATGEGTALIEVVAVDNLGNETREGVTITVEQPDTENPTVEILAPDEVVAGQEFEVQVKATDNRQVKTVEVFADGKAAALDDEGKVQLTASTGKAITILARAVDTSGNNSSAVKQIKIKRDNSAYQPVIEKSVDWIASVQNQDGSWGMQLKQRDTAYGASVLEEYKKEADGYQNAVNWVHANKPMNQDYMSRYLMTGAYRTKENVAKLAEGQNKTGGYGLAKGYGSDIPDTLLALDALIQSDYVGTDTCLQDMVYLIDMQRADGSYGETAKSGSDVVLTAKVGVILSSYQEITGSRYEEIDEAIQRIYDYLKSIEQEKGSWGTEKAEIRRTIWANIFMMQYGEENDLTFLNALQSENGSFYDSVEITAEMLRLFGLI